MHAPPAPNPSAARRSTLITVGLLAVAALAAYRNTFLAAFVLDDGNGQRREFIGRVNGDRMEGKVQRPGGASAAFTAVRAR